MNDNKFKIETNQCIINNVNQYTPENNKCFIHGHCVVTSHPSSPCYVNGTEILTIEDYDSSESNEMNETSNCSENNDCDDIVYRIETVEPLSDTPRTNNAVIEENQLYCSVQVQSQRNNDDTCIICLGNNQHKLMHYTFFSFHCKCNYYIHYECLKEWINKKKQRNEEPCCLLCFNKISSYEYGYINYDDTSIFSPSSNITTNSDTSTTTTDTLSTIVSIISDDIGEVVHQQRNETIQNISLHNRILENIFNNAEFRQIYSRRQLNEVIEHEVRRRRFLDNVVIHQSRFQEGTCSRLVLKIIVFFSIIIGFILMIQEVNRE